MKIDNKYRDTVNKVLKKDRYLNQQDLNKLRKRDLIVVVEILHFQRRSLMEEVKDKDLLIKDLLDKLGIKEDIDEVFL